MRQNICTECKKRNVQYKMCKHTYWAFKMRVGTPKPPSTGGRRGRKAATNPAGETSQ